MIRRILIVGASLAGIRTAESLRRAGFEGSICLLGSERHLPYDRPHLSKGFLSGEFDEVDLELTSHEILDRLTVELVLDEPASSLDLSARAVTTVRGRTFGFDRLIVATGAEPIMPPNLTTRKGVSTFRTVDDAARLRHDMANGRRIAVVGGGFIGAEIAATARGMGIDIALIEALSLDTPIRMSV